MRVWSAIGATKRGLALGAAGVTFTEPDPTPLPVLLNGMMEKVYSMPLVSPPRVNDVWLDSPNPLSGIS